MQVGGRGGPGSEPYQDRRLAGAEWHMRRQKRRCPVLGPGGLRARSPRDDPWSRRVSFLLNCEAFPLRCRKFGDSLRWREMDSNFWYRGRKARDFRNIPEAAGMAGVRYA